MVDYVKVTSTSAGTGMSTKGLAGQQIIVGVVTLSEGINLYRRAVSMRLEIAYPTTNPNFTLLRREQEFRL